MQTQQDTCSSLPCYFFKKKKRIKKRIKKYSVPLSLNHSGKVTVPLIYISVAINRFNLHFKIILCCCHSAVLFFSFLIMCIYVCMFHFAIPTIVMSTSIPMSGLHEEKTRESARNSCQIMS